MKYKFFFIIFVWLQLPLPDTEVVLPLSKVHSRPKQGRATAAIFVPATNWGIVVLRQSSMQNASSCTVNFKNVPISKIQIPVHFATKNNLGLHTNSVNCSSKWLMTESTAAARSCLKLYGPCAGPELHAAGWSGRCWAIRRLSWPWHRTTAGTQSRRWPWQDDERY